MKLVTKVCRDTNDYFPKDPAMARMMGNTPMKKAQPGTVIHGTLREEDLVPAFLDCLEELDKNAADELRANMPRYGTDEMAEFLNEELFNTLNLHAPEGHYFGAHPGDGSDFGFWEEEQGSDWSDLQGFG